MELISILIPNFNKAPYLRETLDSILAQTYTNWECIVIDDHSTDMSMSILQEYASSDYRFRVYGRPVNIRKGACACRNYAFSLAKGEYVNWFDSDDIMDREFLVNKIKCLVKNKNLDFVFGSIEPLSPSHKDYSFFKLDYTDNKRSNYPLNFIIGTFWLPTPSPLFRKSFLMKFGPYFNVDLLRGQEAEFFCRILLTKPNFLYKSESKMFWRITDESITGNYLKASNENKVKLSWPSMKLIILSFFKTESIGSNEKEYFEMRLRNYLRYSKPFSKLFLEIFYLGLKLDIFKDKVLIWKIVIYRHLQVFRLGTKTSTK